MRDSVFTPYLNDLRFANVGSDDLPLIPVDTIVAAMDAIELSAVATTTRLLEEAAERLYNAAQGKSAVEVSLLTWNLTSTLVEPFSAVWSEGWRVGGEQMVQEIRAPFRLPKFAGKVEPTRSALELLTNLEPAGLRNVGAEQAIRDRVFRLSGDFSEDQLGLLRQQLVLSANGQINQQQLQAAIAGTLQVGQRRAELIARTETTYAMNVARVATARRSKLVTHLRFLAIVDKRTSEVCRSRNGLVIPIENEGQIAASQPPLHGRCRSVYSPLMSGTIDAHREMAEDPARQIENRTLTPLPPNWKTVTPPAKPAANPTTTIDFPDRAFAEKNFRFLGEGIEGPVYLDDTGKVIKYTDNPHDERILGNIQAAADLGIAPKLLGTSADRKNIALEFLDGYETGIIPSSAVEELDLDFDTGPYYRSFARSLKKAHDNRFLVADLHGDNVMVNPTTKDIKFIDQGGFEKASYADIAKQFLDPKQAYRPLASEVIEQMVKKSKDKVLQKEYKKAVQLVQKNDTAKVKLTEDDYQRLVDNTWKLLEPYL